MPRKAYRNTTITARGEALKRRGVQSPLDRASPEPLYRQIADRLRVEIEAGRLAAGSRLPSIRELARGLGVNLVTVVTAYRELIRAGLASGQVGRGTFVRPPEAPLERTGRGALGRPPRGLRTEQFDGRPAGSESGFGAGDEAGAGAGVCIITA